MSKKKALFKTPLFYKNRTISGFLGQLDYQNQILRRIQTVLPETLAKHTLHCLIKDKRLLVYTDAAVWATQLRFHNKILLASIIPFSSSPVETVQVRIINEHTGLNLQSVRQQARIPSLEIINVIQNHSLSVSDKHLKLSLQKLSSTLKRLSKEP